MTIFKALGKSIGIAVFAAVVVSFSFAETTQAAEGDVWITPSNQDVETGQNFDIEIHMDTGGRALGAFNMFYDFNPAFTTVDTTQGTEGWDSGTDTMEYMIMANPTDIANGHYRFAGICAVNCANGSDVHLLTIHSQATSGFVTGTSDLSLRVNELSDDLGHALAMGTVTGAIITYAEPPTGIDTPTDTNHSTSLTGSFPNPFNPKTIISFSVARPQWVRISVYDLDGRLVAVLVDEMYGMGTHTADWNGKDMSRRAVSSGQYFCRMVTDDYVGSQKITLVH